MSTDYCPRLSINITEEQRRRLDSVLPWGTQKKVFGVIIDDLLALCDKHGSGVVIGAFLSRHIHLEEIARIELSRKKDNNGDN